MKKFEFSRQKLQYKIHFQHEKKTLNFKAKILKNQSAERSKNFEFSRKKYIHQKEDKCFLNMKYETLLRIFQPLCKAFQK